MTETATQATPELEHLNQQEDVRRALRQTSGPQEPKPPVKTRHKVFIGTYILAILGLGLLRYLIRIYPVFVPARYLPLAQRLTLGGMAIVLILGIGKVVNAYWLERLDDEVSRYNLKRVLNLVVAIVLALIVVSILFANWYTAVVSLGLISLILGFALQTPITSLLAWVYILIRVPYRVGDRIKIGGNTGDVIDVSYLDTTLWEFHGDYLSTDHPSGRIIKFPNSTVLSSAVTNYSWPLFPYIWNEVKFQIAYDSDLAFTAQTMQEVVEKEIGEAMMERVKVFRDLLAKTPVDQLEVRERPAVLFRVSDSTWLEAIVRYVVPPREAGRIKSSLIKKLLPALNAHPERVRFPKGDSR